MRLTFENYPRPQKSWHPINFQHRLSNRSKVFVKAPFKTRIRAQQQEREWKALVHPESRHKSFGELLLKGLQKNDLDLIHGVLKAQSIGIIPKEESRLGELKEILLKKYVEEPERNRAELVGLLKSIFLEMPAQKKIMNRGPIRHGILGFKDHVIHGNDWSKLGPAGEFPKAIHQLAHQIPAPELGYVCKAYAQYLETNGNIQEFDRILAEAGVSFEDYFAQNARRIAQKGGSSQSWTQISPDKPKGVLEVEEEEIRKALSHRGWTGRNVDAIMALPGSKAAAFFEIYGDVIIQTLEGQGMKLDRINREIEKTLQPEIKKALGELEHLWERISDKSADEKWKRKEGYGKVLKLATQIRYAIRTLLLQGKDASKLGAMLSLDSKLESMIDATGMNILSKAPKTDGLLYTPESKTAALMMHLLDNYRLDHPMYGEEMSLLRRDLHAAFRSVKKDKGWAQHTLVPLNRLDRLLQRISDETSVIYRTIAYALATQNTQDPKAVERAEELADGILRGDLLFPISQINSGFKYHVRKLAEEPPWQILSTGDTFGKVVHAPTMDALEALIQKNHWEKERLICFVNALAGAEEPPSGVTAIITPKVIDTLSHLGVRVRQENIVFACLDHAQQYADMKGNFPSAISFMQLRVRDAHDITFKHLSFEEYTSLAENRNQREPKKPIQVYLPKVDLGVKEPILGIECIQLSVSGPKATNIASLASIVPIPESLSIPFSVFEQVLQSPENQALADCYQNLLQAVHEKQAASDLSVEKELGALKETIQKLVIPMKIAHEIQATIKSHMPPGTKFVMTRSSTNGEDLADFSGAGLYSSQPNAIDGVLEGIKTVWASKWNKRAFDARVKAQIPHADLYVSVLIQPCIDTQYGFVTHTVHPITKDRHQVFIELVQGQNEALVSGKIPGTGYGFLYDKRTGEVTRTRLADKSHKFVPAENGGTKIELADYRGDILAGEKHQWEALILQIAAYSVAIEKRYQGVAQDIEGCIKTGEDTIYIVQTRDQLGL